MTQRVRRAERVKRNRGFVYERPVMLSEVKHAGYGVYRVTLVPEYLRIALWQVGKAGGGMTEPKPIGVIAAGQSLHSRTIELRMLDLARFDGAEGRYVMLGTGQPLGHGGTLRGGHVRVLATSPGKAFEVYLSGPLDVAIPAACHGDGVYLADEASDWGASVERREIEAWKAERRRL